jgi:nucleoside-diphosphate-sugar epimerase
VPKPSDPNLTVAVTGPTGTFGYGLLPLLQNDDRISRVVGIARRPFDPLEHGWTKMEYRRGDVRDQAALEAAFDDVDVVIHLAFMITGNAARETVREINIGGTLNAFRAAVTAGSKRFGTRRRSRPTASTATTPGA